jgi:pimeloyl-ACP methyl ester carboxylesterase
MQGRHNTVTDSLPIVVVPGLLCSARLYADQIPVLWPFGPVTVADHRRDDTMDAIARRILNSAPPRFALIGLSMGGYIAWSIMRQSPERVAKLALLDTSARADLPERIEARRTLIAMAEEGRFAEVVDVHFPQFVHRNRRDDATLKRVVKAMAEETGPHAYVRQQKAILGRQDARDSLSAIRCPTVVIVGDGDEMTPPKVAEEIVAGVSDARLVVIADCGHLTTLERPAEVNAALVAWMAERAP